MTESQLFFKISIQHLIDRYSDIWNDNVVVLEIKNDGDDQRMVMTENWEGQRKEMVESQQ